MHNPQVIIGFSPASRKSLNESFTMWCAVSGDERRRDCKIFKIDLRRGVIVTKTNRKINTSQRETQSIWTDISAIHTPTISLCGRKHKDAAYSTYARITARTRRLTVVPTPDTPWRARYVFLRFHNFSVSLVLSVSPSPRIIEYFMQIYFVLRFPFVHNHVNANRNKTNTLSFCEKTRVTLRQRRGLNPVWCACESWHASTFTLCVCVVTLSVSVAVDVHQSESDDER